MLTAAEQEAQQRQKEKDVKAQAADHKSRMNTPRAKIFGFGGNRLPRAETIGSTVMK